MFSQVLHRFLHTCSSLKAVEKAALLELRKKTGYTFTNCKKALEATDNDVKKAEKWLVKEAKKHGWASMGRSGTQGLVAVHVEGPFAAMAEVNCETDFVARTDDFRQFVEKLVRSCVSHSKKLPSLETAVTKVSAMRVAFCSGLFRRSACDKATLHRQYCCLVCLPVGQSVLEVC